MKFFDKPYSKIEEKIKENEGNEIIIDYTSGTKTMTTSAAIAAMLYQKRLSLVSGKRGENGIVTKGTEEPKEQSLFVAYNKYLFDKFKEAFNAYRFEEAKRYLEQIIGEDKNNRKIIDAYDSWDKFNHEKASRYLKDIKDKAFYNNKVFLHNLGEAEIKEEFLIPDLLNNAQRRIKEGKYDDAVARLYRCIEMIAQYRLKKEHGFDSSEIYAIDLESRTIKNIEKYRKMADEKGIIKLALRQDYEFLRDLKDRIGNLIEDKELKKLLQKRNLSILAHGIVPIKRKDAEEFYDKAVEIASKVIKDLEEKMKMAEFPKI